MANSLLLKTLLKSVLPTVQKLVESGKVDAFVQDMKSRYAEVAGLQPGESVEILITTEEDGHEYASAVKIDESLRVTGVIDQHRLSEIITSLFNQSELQ